MVIVNEEVRGQVFSQDQPTVPGQYDPPFTLSSGNKFLPVRAVVIARIETQYPQPFGQLAQHGVGHKFWTRRHVNLPYPDYTNTLEKLNPI
jgi:hypothetical protein